MKKLFFFGIDSATWDLIKPWVKQGKLPGFHKLIKQGDTLDLQSTTPPLTPIAWTSLYTGVNPGKHGIFDFYRMTKDKQVTVNTSNDAKLLNLFHILSKAGKKVASLNMPFTYPVKPLNGIMLGDFMTPGLDESFIYPNNLKSEFIKRFPHYTFSESERFGMDKKSQQQYFQALKVSVLEKIQVFDWLEQKAEWNLFAINFMEVDHVQHWFWQQPDKMYQIYQLIDDYLNKKLKENRYGHYLIFSDHGAGPYLKNLNLNTYFLKQGILKLKTDWSTRLKQSLFWLNFCPSSVSQLALRLNRLPSSQTGRGKAQKIKLFLTLNDIDWQKSLAFSFGYYGSVYLIKKKDKHSKNKVKQALLNLQYQGKPVMDRVWEKQEVYQGAYLKQAPDLLFSPREYLFGSSAISPFLSPQVFSKPHTLKTGEHRFKGIMGIFPKLEIKNQKSEISIPEVSATILDYFNVPLPEYYDGKSILKEKHKEISTINV